MCIFGIADEDMTTSVLLIVALVLTICAVAFQIIGVAPPYWVSIDTASLKMHYGLWTTCTEVQTVTTCEDSDADEGKAICFNVKNLTISQKVSISIVVN